MNANHRNLPIGPHKCQINWIGSSGAMESGLALDLISDIHLKSVENIYVKEMVSDDDSTMRSHLKKAINGDKLNNTIPEPLFLADPSHRNKCMSKPIFKMVASPPVKNPACCKNIDACRIKKYSGCCIIKINYYQ